MRKYIVMFLLGVCSMSAAPHSAADLVAKQMGFWWNEDYLESIGKRVDFSQVKSALDVGCGTGAWTWGISGVLPEDATVVGIDLKASIKPPSDRFSFIVGDANALPFEDESFDLVTCQTLLMHVQDHNRVLGEMARVLKPGGLLILSEPSNRLNLAASNTALQMLSLEEKIDLARLYLICQEGSASIGPHPNYPLPDTIAHLCSFMSEKMLVLTPPYQKEEESALVDFFLWITRKDWFYLWTKEQAERYFLAVYPKGQTEFDRLWQTTCKLNATYRRQIQERTLGGIIGEHLILTIGRKHGHP